MEARLGLSLVNRTTRRMSLTPEGELLLRFAGWMLDPVRRQLVAPDGEATPINGVEYKLLRVFLEHPNRVLDRDQLLDLTQGREADPLDRSIDVQVSRLRKRLGDDGSGAQLIKTVRGEGYVLSAPVERTLR